MKDYLEDKLVLIYNKITDVIHTAISYIKAWALIAAGKAGVRLFLFLIRRPWTGVMDLWKMEVQRNTVVNMSFWLKQNRIMHCHVCLSLDSLRRAGGDKWACQSHAPKVAVP